MGSLLELPLDVLGLILREIRTKRDLQTLCLVCSTLRTLAIPSLYRSVDLPVEDAVLSPKHIKCFLATQNDGVRFIKHLRVLGDWTYHEATKLFRSSQRMRLVNVMVLLLLQRTAKNQLQSFEWLLPSSMSPDVIHQLQAHQSNLRKVSWKYEATLNGLSDVDLLRLPRLSSLSAQNITTVDQIEYVQRWITSCSSLRKLEISTQWNHVLKPCIDAINWENGDLDNPVKCFFRGIIERSEHRPRWLKLIRAARSSWDSGVGLDDVSSIAERMEEMIDPHHPFDHRLQLDSLKLADFPFSSSTPQLSRAINLYQLSSLTLQACPEINCFLDSWRSSSAINLKKLHLLLAAPREDPSSAPRIAASVNKFLGAFAGLQSLVLLSRVHTRHPFDDLSRHSSTLRRLVLDLKTSARSRICIKHDRLIELYRSYRRLTELAVSVLFSQSILIQLGLLAKQLTTLHILNTRRSNSDAISRLADATVIATTAVTAGPTAPLRILCMATAPSADDSNTDDDGGVSAAVAMDIGGDYRWGCDSKDVFYVQRAVNILGSSVPILTRIGVEKAVELQRGRVRVLKVGWGVWGFS
ncbi:hypothetical protein Q9L58_009828 [Maublancomyces gigas]|uniref:F-box domain-containing protein n=1 Tax=Discina gigas TaxID=1032678 RepID=A0ABR3G5W2_9PEZI